MLRGGGNNSVRWRTPQTVRHCLLQMRIFPGKTGKVVRNSQSYCEIFWGSQEDLVLAKLLKRLPLQAASSQQPLDAAAAQASSVAASLSNSVASEAGYTHQSWESVDDASSSDSLPLWRAALDIKLKERNQR